MDRDRGRTCSWFRARDYASRGRPKGEVEDIQSPGRIGHMHPQISRIDASRNYEYMRMAAYLPSQRMGRPLGMDQARPSTKPRE